MHEVVGQRRGLCEGRVGRRDRRDVLGQDRRGEAQHA